MKIGSTFLLLCTTCLGSTAAFAPLSSLTTFSSHTRTSLLSSKSVTSDSTSTSTSTQTTTSKKEDVQAEPTNGEDDTAASSSPTTAVNAASTKKNPSSIQKSTTTVPPPPLQGEFLVLFEQSKMMLTKSFENDPQMSHWLNPLIHFCHEYFSANQAAYLKTKNVKVNAAKPTMQRFFQCLEFGRTFGMGSDRYKFGVTHRALRGKNPDVEDGNTMDYYKFGCDFFQCVMDPDDSIVLGQEYLKQAMEQLEAGENVVFLANHQSEADPQVVSFSFEKCGYGRQAEELTYVAGHKVTTDPLAIPFSMGRNLICIHSKKHMDSDPDLKPKKQRQNLAAMGSMLQMLKRGGCALWVAPSGGRDRRNVADNTVPLAPFDSKTIDMFRLMGNKSQKPTHYYSLAMVSYELCPPPDTTEATVGEQRNVRFSPVGIACSAELTSVGGLEKRHSFCALAQDACQEGYEELLRVMNSENDDSDKKEE